MKFKRMFAAAKQSNVLMLYVYDLIGKDWFGDGVTAQSVADEIAKAGDFDSITMRINSPGGNVFEGLAIYNLVRSQGKPINVIIDGLAASAASVIAMAGDNIAIAESAMVMVHNAWGMTSGNANDMLKMADLLDKVSGQMIDLYAKRTGLASVDVKALLDDETWLSGQEAVDKGFADELAEQDQADAQAAHQAVAAFDLSKLCAKVPDKFKSTPTPIAAPTREVGSCPCTCAACLEGDCSKCQDALCSAEECKHGEGSAAALAIALRDAQQLHVETLLKR